MLEFTDFDIFALTTKTEESTEVTTDEIINVDPCPYDYVQVIDNELTFFSQPFSLVQVQNDKKRQKLDSKNCKN